MRDKIAASKRKGIWVGGPVPLGYRSVAKTLIVVEEEAEQVRTIFQRYLALGHRTVVAAIRSLAKRSSSHSQVAQKVDVLLAASRRTAADHRKAAVRGGAGEAQGQNDHPQGHPIAIVSPPDGPSQ